MGKYTPPFQQNTKVINLLAEICELVGRVEVTHRDIISIQLRRQNQIRSIHSSLQIEQNTLSLEQVTAILNGKHVLGPPHEIREVQNAAEAYALMQSLNPLCEDDLLKAHRLMMNNLVNEVGCFRSGGVGVMAGNQVIHMAPPAHLVPWQIKDLFTWYQGSDLHPLVKSSIFHYEFEFIHPFADGNGRMGRMWHTLLLAQWKPFFAWLSIEELIAKRQSEYYKALQMADAACDCACFVTMMLEVIRDVLQEMPQTIDMDRPSSDQVPTKLTPTEQEAFRELTEALGSDTLSASQLMARMGLVHKPHFRQFYLVPALEKGIIERTIPDKPNSPRQRYRAKK